MKMVNRYWLDTFGNLNSGSREKFCPYSPEDRSCGIWCAQFSMIDFDELSQKGSIFLGCIEQDILVNKENS